MRPKSSFGMQLGEKQKARMFYCVTEKQFAKYVKEALSKKDSNPTTKLFAILETRLDNVLWRSGFSRTHLAARQAAAHGHFLVNGKRSYVPSMSLKVGDKITLREGSRNSRLWQTETETDNIQAPDWLSVDRNKMEITVKSTPTNIGSEALFDLGQVLEYYQR